MTPTRTRTHHTSAKKDEPDTSEVVSLENTAKPSPEDEPSDNNDPVKDDGGEGKDAKVCVSCGSTDVVLTINDDPSVGTLSFCAKDRPVNR